ANSSERQWVRHPIGAEDVEVMFLKIADLDGDGRLDIVAAAREFGLRIFRRKPGPGVAWEASSIDLPKETGTAKGVAVGDMNGDGKLDIVMTCENAQDRLGVVWFSQRGSISDRTWNVHDIDGGAGVKYDLVEAIDLDGDGDLDVLTCEEKENLGVV